MKKSYPHIPGHMSEILASGALGRRAFLLGSAAAAAGATLGAWIPPARAQGKGGTLEMMAWEGYTLEKEAAEWLATEGITLHAGIMGNQDDVTAKLTGTSPVRLDIVEYSNGYGKIYDDLKIMQPLDVSKLPNYTPENMFPPFYQGEMWTWRDQTWAIPAFWGLDTLIYNPEMTGFEMTSYKDLLRPELTGKVAFLDNPLTTWPQIAKLAGYGDVYPNMTKEQVADCFEKLAPYRAQTKVYASSNGDVVSLFAAGEIAACFCVWNGVLQETAKQNVRTLSANPTEGGAVWVDSWFIPHTAGNVEAAHGLINQAIDPKVQAEISNAVATCTVSPNAVPLLDEVGSKTFDYANFAEQFKVLKIYGLPPLESTEFATYSNWLQAWADFRAGF